MAFGIREVTMKSSKQTFMLREIQAIFTNKILLVSYFTITALAIITGPFSTYQHLSLLMRIPYWSGVIAGCFLIPIIVNLIYYRIAQKSKRQKPLWNIILTLIVAILIAAFLLITNSLIWGDGLNFTNYIGFLKLTTPIAFIVAIFIILFDKYIAKAPNEQSSVAFFKRIPTHLGKDLQYLNVQDHYVNAVTDKGEQLILMRLKDAIDELSGMDGVQIHRSYWVAKSAIINVKKSNSKMIIEMKNGDSLPVSRSRLKDVKSALQIK